MSNSVLLFFALLFVVGVGVGSAYFSPSLMESPFENFGSNELELVSENSLTEGNLDDSNIAVEEDNRLEEVVAEEPVEKPVIESEPIVFSSKVNEHVWDFFEGDSSEDVKRVNVVVLLSGAFSEGSVSREDFDSLIEMSSSYGEIIEEFYPDAFVVNIDESGVHALASDDKVEYIELAFSGGIVLDDAVQITGAENTWVKKPYTWSNGLTGKGKTICIVDTGVDFTHPDLQHADILNGYQLECVDGDPNTGDCLLSNNISDENGHGTYVAGIAAANGGKKGIAPEVDIISLKVFNGSSGTFSSFFPIWRALKWCTENSDTYDISAISLSLSSNSLFENNSACDSFSPLTAQLVNNAVAKNISVVAATGNNYNLTVIGMPSCNSNAIPVASTDKNDSFADFSNRNDLVKLVAPGKDVISTCLGGNYCTASGTSVSTPMVSASIAITHQLIDTQGREIPHPLDLEQVFYDLGKKVVDSATSLEFSRIDVNKVTGFYDLSQELSKRTGFGHLGMDNQDIFFYLPFDDNVKPTKVYDYAGSGEEGVVKGEAHFVADGKYGGAYEFDGKAGASDNVRFSNFDPDINFADSFTISAWVRSYGIGITGLKDIVATNAKADLDDRAGFVFRTNKNGNIFFSLSNGTKSSGSVKGGQIADKGWSHIVAVYDESTPSIALYIDGVGGVKASGVENVSLNGGASGRTLFVGSSGGAGRVFNGTIDELMFFSRALDASEVADLYNGNLKRFYSIGELEHSGYNVANTGSETKVDVSFNALENYPGVSFDVQVGNSDGNGGYVYGDIYPAVNGAAVGIPITTPADLSVKIIFNSDSEMFYTPIMKGIGLGNINVVGY